MDVEQQTSHAIGTVIAYTMERKQDVSTVRDEQSTLPVDTLLFHGFQLGKQRFKINDDACSEHPTNAVNSDADGPPIHRPERRPFPVIRKGSCAHHHTFKINTM